MEINIGIDTKNREQIATALSKVQADTLQCRAGLA
jgi:hypothetical protein